MHHHTELSFVDEFRWVSTLHYLKMDDRTLFFFGACCKRGCHLYSTTAPSCCIPASYCHLSATLQTISITVVNLQDNRAVFRIFIALLRFSFDSPSYIIKLTFTHSSAFDGIFKNFIFLSSYFYMPSRVMFCSTSGEQTQYSLNGSTVLVLRSPHPRFKAIYRIFR